MNRPSSTSAIDSKTKSFKGSLLILSLLLLSTSVNTQPTSNYNNNYHQISVENNQQQINYNSPLDHSILSTKPESTSSEIVSINGFKDDLDISINWIGSKFASLMGFKVEDNKNNLETVPINSGLIGWSDSSVYVERTNSLHPSRPSAFGPHITDSPIRSLLFPITIFSTSDEYGCGPSNSTTEPKLGEEEKEGKLPTPPKEGWIALSQRGSCPFSQKVRFAESLGAVAVLFGDQSAENGGLAGLVHLLTPWSPDDTRDIYIPSAFVSRASYLSLLKTYEVEQTLIEEGSDEPIPPRDESKPRGLDVTMAPDDLFTWPLLDFLLLLLFLPSILTGLTLFTQRIRQLRQRKLDRAPEEVVAQLPVYLWGELGVIEKVNVVVDESIRTLEEGEGEVEGDEESNVGLNNESTPLLTPNSNSNSNSTPSTTRTPSRTSTLIKSTLSYLPSFITNPLNPKSSTQLAPSPTLNNLISKNCTECSICLSDFELGERVVGLPCGHIFHEDEIRLWLLRSKRLCPTCRASITIDGTSEEVIVPTSTTPIVVPPTTISSSSTPIPLARNPLLQNLDTRVGGVASSSSVTLDSVLESRVVNGEQVKE